MKELQQLAVRAGEKELLLSTYKHEMIDLVFALLLSERNTEDMEEVEEMEGLTGISVITHG